MAEAENTAAAPAKKRRGLPYEKRKQLYGYGFISIWMIGTLMFFLVPLVKSFWYSFNEVSIGDGKTLTDWVGTAKFDYVINADPEYTVFLKETLIETAWKTPLVLIFSLFIAVILNQKFRGRTLARAIFFLPVLITVQP